MSILHAIRIESLGDPTATASGSSDALAKCWRIPFDARPAFDTDGLYDVEPLLVSLPDELYFEVDFRTGTASTGSLVVQMIYRETWAQRLLRGDWTRVAQLSTAITTTSATTVVLDTSGLEGTTIWLGRECILLGTESGAGPYTYSGCSRGVLGTLARKHGVDPEDDVECFNAAHGPYLQGRRVELIEVDTAASNYGGEVVKWAGVLEDITQPNTETIEIRANSLSSVFKETMLFDGVYRAERISGLGVYQARPSSNDDTRPTEPLANNGNVGLFALGDRGVYRVPTQGATNTQILFNSPDVRPYMGSPPLSEVVENYYLTDETAGAPDWPDEIHEVFATRSGTPGDSASPGDNNLPLSSNPFKLILQLLTTTESGGNGDYDLQHKGLGAGIPSAWIDVAGIEALAETIGAYVDMTGFILPPKGEPMRAYAFLQDEVLSPLGCVLTQDATQIRVVPFLGSLGLDSATTLSVSNLRDDKYQSEYRPLDGKPVDLVDVELNTPWGKAPRTRTYKSTWISNRTPRRHRSTHKVKAGGVRDEGRVSMLVFRFLSRYSRPESTRDVHGTTGVDLWPGDLVEMTHPVYTGVDGTQGLSSTPAQVIGRRYSLREGASHYTLIRGIEGRVVSPSAEAASWSDPTLTVDANAYTSTGNPRYATDADAFADVLSQTGLSNVSVVILDSDLSARGTATMTAAGSNTLTLSSATVTPVEDDVIMLAPYTTHESAGDDAVWTYYAFQADANDLLGADNDAPHTWTY